jgi:hypothetical protein
MGGLFISRWPASSVLEVDNRPPNTDRKSQMIIYGTAWKSEKTSDLVYKAVKLGYRHFDTAAQPRHYREDLVAGGLMRALSDHNLRREQVHVRSSNRNLSVMTLTLTNGNLTGPDQILSTSNSRWHKYALRSLKIY